MSDILHEERDEVLWLTLNRPDDGNMATDEMARDLTEALVGTQCRMVVLRGAGADFCRGRASMGRASSGPPPEALARRRSNDVVFDCYEAFRHARVPVIGLVQGLAAGFGCSLAASCDITIAAASARFQVPEMDHEIMPTMVMSALLDRLPAKVIGWMVYSRAMLDAETVRGLGLVSHVVPDQDLASAADALIAKMLVVPGAGLQGVKDFLRHAPDLPRAGALDFARNLHATVNSSSEMRRR